MLDDAVIIERILAGDESAFEQLLQKYKGIALALALQYTQNIHDAQDIIQEAFCSAYINLPKLV
jgi:DNA-directed RNA polymerase specialized sigma24 family protein